jgi:hypothetical protein
MMFHIVWLIVFFLFGGLATSATTLSLTNNSTNNDEHALRLQLRRSKNDDLYLLQRNLQVGKVGRVQKFRFINAITGTQNGRSLVDPLRSGTIINLSTFAIRTFNIEAVPDTISGPIGSIRFSYGGNSNFRKESNAPYAFCGDTNGIYRSCLELTTTGSYTITATPYSLPNLLGAIGQSFSVSFTITDRPPQPIPSPIKPPTKAPVQPPTKTPTRAPAKIPTKSTTKAPLKATTKSPTKAPAKVPTPVVPPVVPAWIEVNPDVIGLTARHEACFVMVGRKAYLLAGRGINPVNIYNPITRKWTNGTAPPKEIHHTQCVVVDDSIWIVSSWTGGYPMEKNSANIYVRLNF